MEVGPGPPLGAACAPLLFETPPLLPSTLATPNRLSVYLEPSLDSRAAASAGPGGLGDAVVQCLLCLSALLGQHCVGVSLAAGGPEGTWYKLLGLGKQGPPMSTDLG